MHILMQKNLADGVLFFGNNMSKRLFQYLRESVLDPISKTRDPSVWTASNKLKQEVWDLIITTLEDWEQQLGYEINKTQIWIVGSLAGYQYTTTSDLDVHVTCHVTPEQFDNMMLAVPNGKLIPGTDHPVNYWFSNNKDQSLDSSENIYDVVSNEWLKESEPEEVNISKSYILDISKFFMNAIDIAISNYEIHKKQLDEVGESDEKPHILQDLVSDLDALRLADGFLYSFREDAYDKTPFKLSISTKEALDPHYTANELVYKTIEKYGYRDRIKKCKKECEEILKANKINQ